MVVFQTSVENITEYYRETTIDLYLAHMLFLKAVRFMSIFQRKRGEEAQFMSRGGNIIEWFASSPHLTTYVHLDRTRTLVCSVAAPSR